MYVLDTNVVSEVRRHTPQAVRWIRGVQSDTLYLSAITIGEIMRGVMMKVRTDPSVADALRRWLDELRVVYAARILPVDGAVAATWGRLMAQRTRPMADALIASTVRVHNKILVTRNIKGFADMGVELLDPWSLTG